MKVSRYAVLGLSIALAVGSGQASAQETTPAASSSSSMKSDAHMKKDSMKANDSMSSGDSMKSDAGAAKPHHKKGHKKAAEPASASSAH